MLRALLDISLLGFIVILLVIWGLLLAAALQKQRLRLQRVARGILISYTTILIFLTLGELYFRYGYADSGPGLAQENWLARYWKSNSLGFRDREWTPADWAGKKTVIVLGDSFAAGFGLENVEDRASDVLAKRLGDGYVVINAAKPGLTTPAELQVLKSHPVKNPDVVILTYFLNDAEDAAATIATNFQPDVPPPPRLVAESYLLNYFYWTILPRLPGVRMAFGDSYWKWQYGLYEDAQIWNLHRKEIEAFIDYVESIKARLIVVMYPNLQDPVPSIAYVDRVQKVFEARGHKDVLPLYDVTATWPLEDLIVSPRDAHPSKLLQRYTGNQLYERFFAPK